MAISYPGASQPGSGLPMPILNNETSILKDFLSGMEYQPPRLHDTNGKLEAAMRAEMETRNIRCNQLERTLHLAATLIELAYNGCDFAEKKNIALFNWYLIYVDDMASRDASAFRVFQQRFLCRQPQLDPVLDALVDVLHCMFQQYDALCANSIIAATFEFFTSHCIEPEIEALPLIRGAERFPWFLRERTGVAAAFAFMLFPKTLELDILEFIQAMPDMNFWISVTNDLLSFHKEELAGDKSNYVHTRAYVEDKSPLQVLAEMAHELRTSRSVILAAISHSPAALRTWKTWECGYVGWHLAQDRYKLKDMGL